MAAYQPDDYAPMPSSLHDIGSGGRPFPPSHPQTSMPDNAGSSSPLQPPLHGPPLGPGIPLHHPFLDPPAAHRPFMPQWWTSSNNALPPLGPHGAFPPALGNPYAAPAPLHPPPAYVSGSMLQSRPSVPNLHISTPSIHRPGPYTNHAWTGTLALGSLDLASPGFPSPQSAQLPVTPSEHESHRLGANLLSPQYALSRSNSASSMGSVTDSTGQFYSPLSAHGSDYFASEDELRRVSASLNPPHQYVGGRHDTMSPGTIHLSRIHQARPDVKFEVASSVIDSDAGSPLSSALPSPAVPQASLPASPGKRRSCSPANTAPSPASSVFSDASDDWPPRPKQVIEKAGASNAPQVSEPGRTTLALPKPGHDLGHSAGDEEGFASPEDDNDDDDFRPAKRTRSRKRVSAPRRPPVARRRPSPKPAPEYKLGISRSALVQRYPMLVHDLPLFYHALLDDMTMNPLAAPMIGTIPSFATLDRKCELLRDYFHRGRRKLQQLDAFTGRCDARNDLPGRLPELSEPYRVAIRDVRRKIVERCENYKYTRRDILTKLYGKDNWEPIEAGLILWDAKSGNSDPANDLANLDPSSAGRDGSHGASGSRSASSSVTGGSRSGSKAPAAPPASSPGSTAGGGRTVRSIPSRSYLRTRPSPGATPMPENSVPATTTTAAAAPETPRPRRVSAAASGRRGGNAPRARNPDTPGMTQLPNGLAAITMDTPPPLAAAARGPPGAGAYASARSASGIGSSVVQAGAEGADRREGRVGSSPASPPSPTSSTSSSRSS